jgi:sulfur-oxidizing protein SoxZ
MANARIKIEGDAKRGEPVEIRVSIRHPMETGFRHDSVGRAIAKNVIHTLVCRYNGEEVFRAELGSGIAANPYLSFYTIAQDSGEVVFEWEDDAGKSDSARAAITVVA